MPIIHKQRRTNAGGDIDQQHVECAQTELDDRAEGVEREHIEQQVTGVGMREVRKNHALIIPACGNLARREEKHAGSRGAVHPREGDERDDYVYSDKEIGQHQVRDIIPGIPGNVCRHLEQIDVARRAQLKVLSFEF